MRYCHECRGIMVTRKSITTKGRTPMRQNIPMEHSYTATRNNGLEEAMKALQVKCSLYTSGCPALLSIYDYDTHQISCTYQKINCPMYGNGTERCSFAGPMALMKDHIKMSHPNVLRVCRWRFVIEHYPLEAAHSNLCVYVDNPFSRNKFLYKVSKKEFNGEAWYSFIIEHANVIPESQQQYAFRLKSRRGHFEWSSSGIVLPFTTEDDVIRVDTPAAMNEAQMRTLMSDDALDIQVQIGTC